MLSQLLLASSTVPESRLPASVYIGLSFRVTEMRMTISQTSWIFIRQSIVSSSGVSLRVLPLAVGNSADDRDNAQDQRANVDAVPKLVVRTSCLRQMNVATKSAQLAKAIGKPEAVARTKRGALLFESHSISCSESVRPQDVYLHDLQNHAS